MSGQVVDGQRHFLRARAIAVELDERDLIAHVFGNHVECILRYAGIEAVSGELEAYRRAAMRAGTHESLGFMHRVLAEAELKRGRGARALRELQLCAMHAEASGDPVALALQSLAEGAAHGLLGNIQAAYESSLRGIRQAARCGATSVERSARFNAASCETLLGLYPQALESIALLKSQPWPSVDRELDIRGNELTLAVARDDLSSAAEIDRVYSEIASARDSVSARGYRLARIAYLLRLGLAQEAAIVGSDLLKAPTQHDLNFHARAQCLTAEALAECQKRHEAFGLLSDVLASSFANVPEFYASTSYVSGLIARRVPATAVELLERASRIYSDLSHTLGSKRSEAAIAILNAQRDEGATQDSPSLPSAAAQRAAASALRSSAALVDLSTRPNAAASELLALLERTGCASRAWLATLKDGVLSESAKTSRAGFSSPHETAVSLNLGPHGDSELVVRAVPANDDEALVTILAMQRLVAKRTLTREQLSRESDTSALWPEQIPEQQLGFICSSEAMLNLLRVTTRIATSTIPVLITGETGTGKELLARALHFSSPRSAKRFLPFNCTAVPRDMLDSQLFGYRRGAFTGAADAFPGVIRSAAGGTLFLDEIGEISSEVQPKLLRFLESSEVHPLGEPAPVHVDVRIVAATNANLEALVAEGKFREDLFYRLNVVKLTIPPLRERREEIPQLLEHFLERSQRESSKTGVRFSDLAIEYLLLYDWPGNVRELANEVRRAVALAESGAVLMPEHLSQRIAASRRTIPSGQRPPTPSELIVRRDQPLSAAIEHVERAMIQDALRRHANVEDAAKALGLSRKGLYLKRQRLKIDEAFLAS